MADIHSLESKLGPEIRNTGLRSREIDAIKGILIVCIALGHNGHFPAGVSFLASHRAAQYAVRARSGSSISGPLFGIQQPVHRPLSVRRAGLEAC